MRSSLKIVLNREDNKKIVVTLQGVKQGLTSQDLVALKPLIDTDKIFKDCNVGITNAEKFVAVEVSEREL